jgi:DNA repair exonuclease SbcCD ATPase subunit
MFDILNFTETLTIKCCPVCSIRYAAPESMFVRIKERGGSWHCPNGHVLVFNESEADGLKKALESEKRSSEYKDQRIKSLNNDLMASSNRLRATKAAKTRLKNRIAVGVCPCCNRTFQDLARHMAGKHPEFKHE